MENKEAKDRLLNIAKKSKDGLDPNWVSAELLAVREMVKVEKDPAVIKILRLASEYIQDNENFDLGFFEEEEEEMDISEFDYLIQLIVQSDKPANREEITTFRDLLWEALY